MAAATATVPGLNEPGEETSVSCRPTALVLFNPVYNNGPGEYGYGRVKARYKEISPAHNIRPGMPPALVFFGTKDKLVSVATAKAFQAKMKQVGSRSELQLFPGLGHGFFNKSRGNGKAYLQTLRSMDAFLASLGLLPTKPKKSGT